ncbi:hypothetical protein PC123_g24025 [Phytophthora cactorum]|nr:hypothetical protein PC123_g24025 [Phytophthora cactorum]
MRKGEIPNDVESRYMNEELEDPTDKISTILSSEIPEGSIHVLVVVPVDPTTVMLKQQNEEDGSSVHNAHYDGVIEIIERRYHVYDERTPLTRGLR